MPAARVNPTRMELTRTKNRLKTAVRGHKLLKDKHDEMVRRFMQLIRQNRDLREEVEPLLVDALREFAMARALMNSAELEQAIMAPAAQVDIQASLQNIMSVSVPKLELQIKSESSGLPYGFAQTSDQLDGAIRTITEVLPKLIELAETEKICDRLADEIEKTRRRVNALEYVMIPQMDETIRTITMKLDENERGNLTRLMKVKDMLAQRE